MVVRCYNSARSAPWSLGTLGLGTMQLILQTKNLTRLSDCALANHRVREKVRSAVLASMSSKMANKRRNANYSEDGKRQYCPIKFQYTT